ncbi:hypothetical protein PaG_00489 [Moesziomyces aphidis]|uniref:Guanine nucleotide-binding protein beta 5 n=1 Tax=Moesziomyces aphidis TaxID=84754 RepID=W3VW74_MOEAP|nr:hypothetical protein PaG_00489 [Moesziomyces aphidis]
MLADAESPSEGSRTAAAIESEYPTPPELSIAAWRRRMSEQTKVTSPHLLAQLDRPALCAISPAGDSKGTTARRSRPSSSARTRSDFYRRASWAPDGSVLLAITESQRNHILGCYASKADDPSPSTSTDGCRGAVELLGETKSPSPLLDAIWYPVPALDSAHGTSEESGAGQTESAAVGMTPTMTWCFAESHRDLPTRLTASSTGEARASYSIMNHVERFVGPHALAVSPDLSRLYCGLWSALAVFPLSRPGLNTHSSLPLVAGKRSRGGQRGIVSALATAPNPANPTHDLVAAATFSGSVGIYGFDPAAFPEPAEHTARHDEDILAQTSCLAGWSEIEGDGVTQLRFHPLTPYVLFVASRRSDHIYVYDIRYLMGDSARWSFRPLSQPATGVRSAHLLAKLHRPGGASAQRLFFDIDWAGRWLASGDDQGSIHLWRIDTGRFTDSDDAAGQAEIAPDLSWKAHQDAIGSVSFHPHQPWLASVSGSRHWPEDEGNSSSESDRDSSDSDSASASDSSAGSGHFRTWQTRDSSLNIWDFSDPDVAAS